MKRNRMVSLLVLAALLVTVVLPGVNVYADDGVAKGAVPITQSPIGLILDRTPTFTWIAVSGANKYIFELHQSGTKVFISPILESTDVCVADACSMTTGLTLDFRPYEWRVKAKVGGVWGEFSPFAEFVVSSPSFASKFNGNIEGWDMFNNEGGVWYPSAFSAYTPGKPGFWSPFYRYANGGKYNDLDFTARIKRVGGVSGKLFPANCLMVRMGSFTTAGAYIWWPGYRFCINNTGKYEIWFMDEEMGNYSIQKWTYSSAIIPGNNWNKLRVVAAGPEFDFYINNVLVKSFSDNSKDRGFLGFSMYRYPLTTTKFQVDYAQVYVHTLTSPASSAAISQVELVPVSESSVIGAE